MYDTVLLGFSEVYDALESAKGDLSLPEFEQKLHNARGRISWYQNHVKTAQAREPVHLALFHNDYSQVDFSLKHADAQTPWILANELSKHVQIDLNGLVRKFWANAAIQLEALAKEDSSGRRFGFWPVVARSAPAASRALWPVAAGALLGASAYSTTQAEESETYLEKAKRNAGTFGVGLAFGAAAALLLFARNG